jgi:hypothetical protein
LRIQTSPAEQHQHEKQQHNPTTMPEVTITGWDARDVRFPTSLDKTGSDAMNAAGDYSAAYCILKTDSQFSGHGMVPFPSPPPQTQEIPN